MPAARRPPALQGRVFRSRDVLAARVLTPAALRSSAWRRLYRGIYADADLPDSFGLRIRGAGLLVPECAVFSGRTAAYLHGAASLAEPTTAVEVSIPTGARFGPVTGLRVRHVVLPAEDVVTVRRRRVTSPVRTALDIARWEPLPDSVSALDVLLGRAIVGKSELGAAADNGTGRGCRRIRRAVQLADPRAESPPESRLRVLLTLAGLPAVPQLTVRDDAGAFVARVDLALPEYKIAIEYDGAWHGAPGQLHKDRRRQNLLTAVGWRTVYVTAAHMYEFESLVLQLKALIAATPTSGK